MSSINFLSENLVNGATLSITSGVQNAQYPLSNLKNDSPSIKFQSIGSTVTIVFDMLTTSLADTVALVGDPTGELGLTDAVLKGSTTLDFSLSTAINIDLNAEHNMGITFFPEESFRYWQLELTGGSYAEMGNIFIGKRLNLPQQNWSIGSFQYRNNDKSTIRGNEYGQRFIDVRNLQKKLRGTIEYADKTEMTLLDNMFIYHGRSRPIWVIVDKDSESLDDGLYRFGMYGYFLRMPSWSASGGQHYNATMSILEAI